MFSYDRLIIDIAKEFPKFKIIQKKDSAICKSIDHLLKGLSFGKMDSFMTRFTTTIGYTVYVPEGWDERDEISKYLTLYHERVHMRQHRDVGEIKYSLKYLFWPFPIFFAKWRMKFEAEAYASQINEAIRLGAVSGPMISNAVDSICGSGYLWSWYSTDACETEILRCMGEERNVVDA